MIRFDFICHLDCSCIKNIKRIIFIRSREYDFIEVLTNIIEDYLTIFRFEMLKHKLQVGTETLFNLLSP